MKLSQYLNVQRIIPEMKAATKEDAINEIVDLFKEDASVNDIDKMRAAIFEREKIMSTGVGKNFAIPHGKTNAVTDVVCAYGRSINPIDYDALDKAPVHHFFLIVGRDDMVSLHIKLLSRITRLMAQDKVRNELIAANSAEEIYNIFTEGEGQGIEI